MIDKTNFKQNSYTFSIKQICFLGLIWTTTMNDKILSDKN